MEDDYGIESTFKYKNGEIRNIVIYIDTDNRKHSMRYTVLEENSNEVEETVHETPHQWDADHRDTEDTRHFNAKPQRITEIMEVKKIAENRVREEGFKLARYEEE